MMTPAIGEQKTPPPQLDYQEEKKYQEVFHRIICESAIFSGLKLNETAKGGNCFEFKISPINKSVV
jgi:hypothetical protein